MSEEHARGIGVVFAMPTPMGRYDHIEPSDWEIKSAAVRQSRTVVVRDENFPDLPERFPDLIAWLGALVAEIPEPYRDTASIKFGSEGGYEGDHYLNMEVSYERPETDEEWAARRADIECRAAAWTAKRNADEKAQFERLKAKFGEAT